VAAVGLGLAALRDSDLLGMSAIGVGTAVGGLGIWVLYRAGVWRRPSRWLVSLTQESPPAASIGESNAGLADPTRER
jgi:hypothetical protein